jgi:opacity protein-like surface antigen
MFRLPTLLKPFFPILLAALAATPVCVQAQSAAEAHGGAPNTELYGGYSYVFRTYNPTQNTVSTSGMNGWDASLKIPLLGTFLGIKGDVSGFYRNDNPNFNPKAYFFLIGPQVGVPMGRSTLFAHGMVGSAHLTSSALPNIKSDNTFAVAVGAGLDFGIARNLAWRVTGDYYNTHYQATNRNFNEIINSNGRISTGPVIRF